MSFWSAVAITLAGTGAGLINTIVGSGTLITFPTLLFFGVNPLVANVSNNIGMVAGGVTGSWGYRHELGGQAPALRRLMPLSFVGSVVGAGLLLVLPATAFRAIVPGLILIALVLVLAGPRIQARAHPEGGGTPTPAWHAPAMGVGVFVAGVYGGYFGAAQGVLLMGLFSALSLEPLQRLNGYKNVLALVVNFVAAAVFVVFARDHIDWLVVLLIAVGAFTGGIIGARVGRRIPPNALRALIIAIGLVAVVKLVWFP
ncbi:sulfite exporter TauE/SafE family protein [Terrabacter sp. 2RAF25]|uniref:sulfite exporter TauE/SafE family protein n=1 Tax=Terrabacter sp. 2RAF25 TaxID=3232998 RepID=UPI003F94FA21